MSLSDSINALRVPEVTITENGSRLSLESQSGVAISTATSVVKDLISSMKMPFHTLEQRCFINEVYDSTLMKRWINEFDLHLKLSKKESNYSLYVHGTAINIGKFFNALNDYHSGFSQQFSVMLDSKQKLCFMVVILYSTSGAQLLVNHQRKF
ncbi:hypothetical protein GEMRC1_013580 [Eukaryota sp. GEM-RC1]